MRPYLAKQKVFVENVLKNVYVKMTFVKNVLVIIGNYLNVNAFLIILKILRGNAYVLYNIIKTNKYIYIFKLVIKTVLVVFRIPKNVWYVFILVEY